MADLLKEKEWIQTELASRSGVSREMIGKYKHGETAPSIEAARKLRMHLKCRPNILYGKASTLPLIKNVESIAGYS